MCSSINLKHYTFSVIDNITLSFRMQIFYNSFSKHGHVQPKIFFEIYMSTCTKKCRTTDNQLWYNKLEKKTITKYSPQRKNFLISQNKSCSYKII